VSPENLGRLIDRSKPAPGVHLGAESPEQAISPSSGVDHPTNDIETEVARIWIAVFGHKQIGIHQNFSELGGHSLIAMQIVARVRSFYQIDLSLRDFFAAPTIARLSAEVEGRILREIENLSDDEAGRLVQTISADRVS
jgi:acyl carrier protein